jgi:O-antigen ligase
MASIVRETPLAMAEGESSAGAAPAPSPTRPKRSDRVAWWLYWGHLAGLTGIAPSNILLGLAVLVAVPGRAVRALARPATRPLLLALGLYVLQLGLSTAGSFDTQRSATALTELFALCTLLLGLAFARGERALRRLVDAVLLLATVEALVALVQVVLYGGPDLARRIHGTLPHYMTFSGVLLVADLLLLARVATRGIGGPAGAGWRALALVPINAALLASLTRSAWLGLAAGLLALLVVSRRRLLLWGVPALLLLLLLFPEAVLQRVVSIADPYDATATDRVAMAKAGVAMIGERPLLGQGPNMVQERYPLFRQPEAVRPAVPHLHDAFLQIAAERGLPALAWMLLLLGLPLLRAVRGYRREGGPAGMRADLWLGVAATVVGFAVAGLFEDNWGDVEVRRLLLMVLAMPYGLALAGELEVEMQPREERAPAAVLPFR